MMKTLLVGAGSVGGTLAVLMQDGGVKLDVLEINEARAQSLREKGITLTGAKGEHTQKFDAYSSASELPGDYDICIIATKYQALLPALNGVMDKLSPDCIVAAVQNGLCIDMIVPVVGADRAVGVMIGFGATMLAPDRVEMTSGGEFYIGMADGSHPPRLDTLREMFGKVLPTKISDDIRGRLWSKLIVNSCINATAAITGETLGNIVSDKRARRRFLDIAREDYTVARALGVKVPKYGAFLEYRALMLPRNRVYDALCEGVVMLVGKSKYAKVKPSTLQALERGEKTEIDIFNGYVAKKAAEVGVDAPVSVKITEMIREIERGERKITPDNLNEF